MRIQRLISFAVMLLASVMGSAQTLTTVANFGGSDAAPDYPASTLILGTDGNLYGTTAYGGIYNTGLIIKFTPSDGVVKNFYTFCGAFPSCPDGYLPGGIMQASDGNLYGTTLYGGDEAGTEYVYGTLFKITLGGAFTTFYSFCSTDCFEGPEPVGSLVEGSDRNLYGVSQSYGGGNGTIFRVSLNGALTTLYTFCANAYCSDGEAPSGLVQGSDGDLYGTAVGGGLGGGTVFKITKSGAFTLLYSFCTVVSDGCTDGVGPTGLVEGPDGAFYGTTISGGTHAQGTVFKITASGALTTLYNFCSKSNSNGDCLDGNIPTGGLLLGSDGNYYGATSGGGVHVSQAIPGNAGGTIFRMTPLGVVSTLYSFCAKPSSDTICLDGFAPIGGLRQVPSGLIYGTTSQGGSNAANSATSSFYYGGGTMFSLAVARSAAAKPTFSPSPGSYASPQTVTISSATPGATIYYTTNGTTPTTSSTKYAAPITIYATATFNAIAIATGYATSAIATGVYTIAPATATPTFSPAPGTYPVEQTVSIDDATSGASIYYTTNGSTPTTASTKYSTAIKVSSTETLRAIAVAPGHSASTFASATYTIKPVTAAPTFSPGAGTYTVAQTVSIRDATSGASIYYTTDGSTPTTASTKYSTAIKVNSTETLRAIAVATGHSASAIASATYTIKPVTAAPTFSPGAGTYTAAQTVSIKDATSGASIYYTTDGSTPTTASTKYSTAIKVNSTETLRAIAVATGHSASAIASAAYNIEN